MKFLSSGFPVVGALMVLAMPAVAQVVPSKDVDTVKSGIGEESLAPVVVKQPVAKVSEVAVVTTVATSVSVTETVAADPFVVKGVVATLSGTTGFDRDAALEVAARQALPGVLVSMGHTPDKAAKSVKGVGSAMRFVKSFKIVKESLLPVYTLTTDMTFNGPMVQKNFGGAVPVAKPAVVIAVSGTEALPVDAVEVAVPTVPVRQWVVRISERDPALVDRVRVNLSKQASTRATYRLVTSAGAELVVDSPLDAPRIMRAAGREVEVVELEVPLPTAVVPAGSAEHPWQGQSVPGVPGAPNAPSEPGAPAAPEGTY